MTNQQGRLRTRVAVFACVAAAALIVDQLTKAWAMAALSNGQTIRVIPGLLSFTLVRNPGASLGMGSGAYLGNQSVGRCGLRGPCCGWGAHCLHEMVGGDFFRVCRRSGQPD